MTLVDINDPFLQMGQFSGSTAHMSLIMLVGLLANSLSVYELFPWFNYINDCVIGSA